MSIAIHDAARCFAQASLGVSLLLASPLTAQDAGAPPAGELPPPPIVVFADRDTQAEGTREVLVGSRVPRRPVFVDGVVATSTGTRGLTPGSGMTPSSLYVRLLKRSECVADRPDISEPVACRLIAAREAMAGQDHSLVRGLLIPVAENAERSGAERYASAEMLALSAEGEEDRRYLEEAYELMLESGGLQGRTRASLLRVLAGMALDRGDRDGARDRYAEAVAIGEDDPRTFVNLAILQRETGVGDAAATMRRAIAMREAKGEAVPPEWRAFAAR